MSCRLTLASLLVMLVACGDGRSAADEAYLGTLETWRAERLARLRAPGGYLSLAGLYWLSPGSSSFGSGAENDLVFPGGAPRIGTFDVVDGGVRMRVYEGVDVTVGGELVDSVFLPDDSSEAPLAATLGSLTWTVINRQGRLGIRLRDLAHPALEALPPIPYFPADAAWRIPARLKPYDRAAVVNVATVIDWLGWNPTSPGVVEFELGGERFALEAYDVEGRLFFVFGDETSGRETYPAGRFLYADPPGPDGSTVLDFNQAYNPPCVFNDFATCPVASRSNRLAVAITAGEKYDSSLYFGSAH